MSHRIESFLSARLHLSPQIVADRIYFISNLSGRLSLYAMYYGGSMPEPLLPPDIAMQNPELVEGHSFFTLPLLDRILVMLDRDGDENYLPMFIPIDGGYPELVFGDAFSNHRVRLSYCDIERNIAYMIAERRDVNTIEVYRADLRERKLTLLDESMWSFWVGEPDFEHSRLLLMDGYSNGDNVLFLLEGREKKLLYGMPIDQRGKGEIISPNGLGVPVWSPGGTGVLLPSATFDDKYSLGWIDPSETGRIERIQLDGTVHSRVGELVGIRHLKGTHYGVQFNIDGCSWLYEGIFNQEKHYLTLKYVICGEGDLADGVIQSWYYDRSSDRFVLTFSTATSPTQIYTVEDKDRATIVMHTDERLLGIPADLLSKGEDASFTSHDGRHIPARLYLPAESLGFTEPRPLVYYIHGGPQGQERPDFSWFSMPLIQYLTLRGFAVFVPNVRGSSGYGLEFTKLVDRDWGGQDRLDHVHAMTKFLPKDKRLDVRRAAVMGRSYGGYMTLTLVGRHPQLWSAACDMFGPYDLITFSDRVPETWKPYFKLALGDPDIPSEREFLIERSPKTYLEALSCPLLVIQGRNDPRVVAAESEQLVEDLKGKGKMVEMMVFEDEGHDVLKLNNRAACYNRIADFFAGILKP